MKKALSVMVILALLLTQASFPALAGTKTRDQVTQTPAPTGQVTEQPTPSASKVPTIGGALTATTTPAPSTSPKPTPIPTPTAPKVTLKPVIGGALSGATPMPTTVEPTATPIVRTREEVFLDELLTAQAELQKKDAWARAILSSGAQDVTYADGVISFTLRSYNPALKELGAYEDGKADYLARLCANASRHDLSCTLKATEEEGKLSASKAAIKSMVKIATKAASQAKSGFGDKKVRIALTDWLFGGMDPDALKLSADAEQLKPLFVPQFKQTLSAKGGPAALSFTIHGAVGEELAYQASEQAIQDIAKAENAYQTEGAKIKAIFQSALATQAEEVTKKECEDYTFTLDVDKLAAGDPGEDFRKYVKAYLDACDSEVGWMLSVVPALPYAPAQEYPKSGRLTGSTKGTKVIFKVPADAAPHYVQMRDSSTGQVAVTLFIRPGESGTVRVPKGKYIIMDASGPLWYGENQMFDITGYYSKTEAIQIKGGNYYHVITLEGAKNPNLKGYESSPLEFNQLPSAGSQT